MQKNYDNVVFLQDFFSNLCYTKFGEYASHYCKVCNKKLV